MYTFFYTKDQLLEAGWTEGQIDSLQTPGQSGPQGDINPTLPPPPPPGPKG